MAQFGRIDIGLPAGHGAQPGSEFEPVFLDPPVVLLQHLHRGGEFGVAAPEMYRRDGSLGPWTDIYAIGACIYACMQGYPPNDAPQRIEKDRLALSLSRLRNVYSDNLIEVTEWWMSLDPLSRPQSVFALQKELSRETERRYTKLSFSERLKLQIENLTTGAKA